MLTHSHTHTHTHTHTDSSISSTTNNKQKVQRRHSFGQIPSKNPKKAPSSIPKLTNPRPHSFYMENDDHSSEIILTSSCVSGSLSLLAPTLPPSQPTPPHTSPLTAPSPGLSPSSTAQAHTCLGTTASSASTIPLYNTTSSFNSTSVSPASSRPTLMTQLSLASACTADSPSPVERDGIGGAKNWTNGSCVGMHSVSLLYSSQERLSNGRCDDLFVRNKTASTMTAEQGAISESVEDSSSTTRSSVNDYFQFGSYPLKDVEVHRTQLERLRSSSSFLQQKKYSAENRSQQHTKRHPVPLYLAESISNPEFPLTNHCSLKSSTERARSYGDLYTTNSDRRDIPALPVVKPKTNLETKAISPSREKLNTISHHVCTSLEQNWCGKTMKSSLTCSGSMVGIKLNPVYDIVQKILNEIAPSYSLSQEQMQMIIDSVSTTPTFHVTQEHETSSANSSMNVVSLSGSAVYGSCREGLADVGYVMEEHPYNVRLESEGYMALYFRVKRKSGHSKQMDCVGQRSDSDNVHLKVSNI